MFPGIPRIPLTRPWPLTYIGGKRCTACPACTCTTGERRDRPYRQPTGRAFIPDDQFAAPGRRRTGHTLPPHHGFTVGGGAVNLPPTIGGHMVQRTYTVQRFCDAYNVSRT